MKCEIELSPHGELRCWFPPGSAAPGHHVDIPPTTGGLQLLVDILTRRERGERKIGTLGAPTQWDIEKEVKAFKGKKPAPKVVEGIDVTALAEELDI